MQTSIAEPNETELTVKRALTIRIGHATDEIAVSDDHGTVTLSGPVFSIDERQKVLEAVRAMPGVLNVQDHLYFRGYRIEW